MTATDKEEFPSYGAYRYDTTVRLYCPLDTEVTALECVDDICDFFRDHLRSIFDNAKAPQIIDDDALFVTLTVKQVDGQRDD